jgi:hypothetical protein
MTRRIPSVAFALAFVLFAGSALADRVANVHARGDAKADDRARVEKASEEAIRGLGHTSASAQEIVDGEAAAGTLVGTSAGLVAVGKTTGSEWVVEAVVSPTPGGLRVELKACQVSTGRVESAARELDLRGDVMAQIREVLALLLRPQGIADDPLPWLGATPTKPPEKAPEPKKPVPTPGAPAAPPAAPPEYGRPGALYVGLGGGAYDVVARPDGARGGRVEGAWSVEGGYSLPSMQRLELTARVGGYFGDAGAVRIEAGGRYMLPIASVFAIGAAANLGVLAATTSSQTVRLTLGVSPVLAIALGKTFQLDFSLPAVRLAPGSSGALVFVGGEVAIVARL